jgi:hypothetical protein
MRANPAIKSFRLMRAATAVIDVMHHSGQTLHLEFNWAGPRWRLSGGGKVAHDVAQRVIANPAVISDGDALFPNLTPQTWRACK